MSDAIGIKADGFIMGPAGRIKPQVVLPEGAQAHPALRGAERRQAQEEQRRRAEEAATRRMNTPTTLGERVETAAKKMNGQNVAAASITIRNATPRDQEAFLLAEEYLGRDRSGLKKMFPRVVTKKGREAFLRERGAEAPDQSA